MSDTLQKLLAEIPDTYQKTVGFPIWVIAKAFALGIDQATALITAAEAKLNPENLIGADLDTYIRYRSDISRIQAVFAEGIITVYGTGTIHRGDIFATVGGVRFTADEDVNCEWEADVHIRCETAGSIGNVPAESIKFMPMTIAGIFACTNKEPITGGCDAETDKHLLERFIFDLQKPTTSGNIWHYTQWALSVDGVGDCKVFPLGHGANTVDVVLMGGDGRPANPNVVKNVQEYIDPDSSGVGSGTAPIGAKCFVSAADALKINVEVQIKIIAGASQEKVKTAVNNAISEYLTSIAFKQNYVSLAKVGEAILNNADVIDYQGLKLNNTYGNLVIEERQVPVLDNLEVIFDG